MRVYLDDDLDSNALIGMLKQDGHEVVSPRYNDDMNKHHKGHEYDKYIAYWKKRLKQGRDLQSERFKRSQEAIKSCARLLTGKYQIQRLYLFGSAAGWSSFHERSDLDLAVEGLPADRYFKALSELDRHLPPGIELDLVPLEDAHPELKARILKEGILLYER